MDRALTSRGSRDSLARESGRARRSPRALSSNAVHDMREAFQALDVNNDSRVEVSDLYNLFGRLGYEQAAVRAHIEGICGTNTKSIDFKEFFKCVAQLVQRNLTTSRAKEIFRFLDASGEGAISAEELGRALDGLGLRISESEVSAMMEAATGDLDGTMNARQFRSLLKDLREVRRG